MNNTRTPTSFIADSLGKQLAVINHASFFSVEYFNLTWFLVVVHPSQNYHFCLINWKNVLEGQKFNVPSHFDTTPLLAFKILYMMRTKDPNLFVEDASRRAVVKMLHWLHLFVAIKKRIVFLTSVCYYFLFCCVTT